MTDDLERRRAVAEAAGRAAGAFHLKHLSSTIDFEAKTDPRDVVTKADYEARMRPRRSCSGVFLTTY